MIRQAFAASGRTLLSAPRSFAAAAAAPSSPALSSLLRPRRQYRDHQPTARTSRTTPTLSWTRQYSGSAEPEAAKTADSGQHRPGDEPQAKPSAESEPTTSDAPVSEIPEVALRKALEAKEAEARDWKDRALRQTAEFYNLQERATRERKQAREFAIQGFAKDLLDSVDNLDRALETVPASRVEVHATAAAAGDERAEVLKDLISLHEGLRLTESGLMQALARHGLTRFDPTGERFNPNEHEATFMTPQPDREDGTVFHVQQKGFRLNGRVVRAAKVGVVKNSG